MAAGLYDCPWPENELLPQRVDRLGRVTPEAPFAEFPLSTTYDEGYYRVTYGILANAVNGLAWWFESTLGHERNGKVLAYIGPNDLRYTALTLGAVKAGYLMLYVSPHNSAVAQSNLFSSLQCQTLIIGEPLPSLVATLLATVGLRILEAPSVFELTKPHRVFPFEKAFEDIRFEPLVALHTSGSTGLPKPIVWTHEFAAAYVAQASLKPPSGFGSQNAFFQKKRVFLTFPPYNGAYIVNHLFNAIPLGTVIINTPNAQVPTTESLIQGLQRTSADAAFTVPSIITTLAREPQKLDIVRRQVRVLIYCGGTIPEELGNIVNARIRLLDQYGASEAGLMPSIYQKNIAVAVNENERELCVLQKLADTDDASKHDCTQEDFVSPFDHEWQYACFHPSVGAKFRQYSNDLYELVIVRNCRGIDVQTDTTRTAHHLNCTHPAYHHLPMLPPQGHLSRPNFIPQPAFAFFPHASEYNTRDLWSPHPSKPGFWRLQARIDDLVTLNTGQAVNPIPYEQQILAENHDVESVLMWGGMADRIGLLVEMRDHESTETVVGDDSMKEKEDSSSSSDLKSLLARISVSPGGLRSHGDPNLMLAEHDLRSPPAHNSVCSGELQDHEMVVSTLPSTANQNANSYHTATALLNGLPTPVHTSISSQQLGDSLIHEIRLQKLCATIEAVNQKFSMQVASELVVIARPNRPLCRAGKGTMQRLQSIDLYKSEIEEADKNFRR